MKRIVTTEGADGRSRILVETDVPPFGLVWESDPANWLGSEPDGSRDTLEFRPGGLSARHIEIPPDAVMADYLKQGIPGLDANGFHRTPTLDYLILLEGRLVLELDEGRAELKAGDVVVQRGTNHAWRNPEATPARCLAIMHCRPETAA